MENISFETRLDNLGKEILETIKNKLKTFPEKKYILTDSIPLVIDTEDGNTSKLDVTQLRLVGCNHLMIFGNISEERIEEILDFENSNGYFSDECWEEETDKYVEWEGMALLADILPEEEPKMSWEKYKEAFDRKWKETFEHYTNRFNRLEHLCASPWVTDCGSDYDKFAEWFYKQDYTIENTWIDIDIFFKHPFEPKIKLLEQCISGVLGKPYHNSGQNDVFWRMDSDMIPTALIAEKIFLSDELCKTVINNKKSHPDKEFPCVSITRRNLSDMGYDITSLDEDTMKSLAKRIRNNYESNQMAIDLDIFAEHEGLHRFEKGDKVIWHDPAISDFPEEEREAQKNKIWTIFDDKKADEGVVNITDGCSEAEVFCSELSLAEETI